MESSDLEDGVEVSVEGLSKTLNLYYNEVTTFHSDLILEFNNITVKNIDCKHLQESFRECVCRILSLKELSIVRNDRGLRNTTYSFFVDMYSNEFESECKITFVLIERLVEAIVRLKCVNFNSQFDILSTCILINNKYVIGANF